MNRKHIINSINLNQYQNCLIIDDNKGWEHDPKFTRIKQFVTGDLHDFFDLVTGEELFKSIDEQFDLIFIGEIFHVIELQTLVYNLEYATECLNRDGKLIICINQDSLKTSRTEYRKIIGRLELLPMYNLTSKQVYVDEHAKEWTMLTLQVKAEKTLEDADIANALVIGREITNYLNQGKNLNKLKTGYLISNSSLDNQAFKQAYTNNQELIGLYFQNQIVNLEPSFKRNFLLDLADFIFTNRKALNQLDNLSYLQQGTFAIAIDDYTKTTMIQDKQYVGAVALLIEQIWNRCLKQKINDQLLQAIAEIKE